MIRSQRPHPKVRSPRSRIQVNFIYLFIYFAYPLSGGLPQLRMPSVSDSQVLWFFSLLWNRNHRHREAETSQKSALPIAAFDIPNHVTEQAWLRKEQIESKIILSHLYLYPLLHEITGGFHSLFCPQKRRKYLVPCDTRTPGSHLIQNVYSSSFNLGQAFSGGRRVVMRFTLSPPLCMLDLVAPEVPAVEEGSGAEGASLP